MVRAFGADRPLDELRSNDFEKLRDTFAKTLGPVALGNEINRVRIVCNYAFKAELTDRSGSVRPSSARTRKRSARPGKLRGRECSKPTNCRRS
jgi:hypothetical protein